ncbi:hypothetical protein ABPG72_003800 [Tetrahymena utriculariae]
MSLENSIKEETTIKSQRSIVFRCIVVGLGGFLYGYVLSELTILSGVLKIKLSFQGQYFSQSQTAIVGIMSLGACLICLASDKLINKYGRRNYIIASDIIFLIGTIVGITYEFFEQISFLLAARFIMGIAIGMNSNVVSMYIREISPEIISGQNGSIFQIQINLGIISGIALNFAEDYGKYYVQANLCTNNNIDFTINDQCKDINSSRWWVFVIAFPALFSVIRLLILTFKYKLDTPYYYFSVEKFEQGIEILKELYKEKYVLSECQNILAACPKKVRLSYLSYRNRQQQQKELPSNDQVNAAEYYSQGNQKNIDITSNSNLNYDNDDEYFNEYKNQYPLEGVDIYSNSQQDYNYAQDENQIQESFTQKAKELKQKSLYKRMRRGMILNLLQQLTGINYIIQYTCTILQNLLNDNENNIKNNIDHKSFIFFYRSSNILTEIVLLSNIFLLMAAFVGSFLNKSFGRRNYLFGGYLICGFLHSIFAIVSKNNSSGIFQAVFITVFVFVFYGTFNCSIGPVTWIYTSDILKGKYLFYSIGCNWFGVFLASLMYLNDDPDKQWINFGIFSFFCFVGAVYSYKKIIETEGKKYFQIIKEYAE